MSNLTHELMTDEEWAQLSDAERIERLELVIDFLLDVMLVEEMARHRPQVAQQSTPHDAPVTRGRGDGHGGPLPTCD